MKAKILITLFSCTIFIVMPLLSMEQQEEPIEVIIHNSVSDNREQSASVPDDISEKVPLPFCWRVASNIVATGMITVPLVTIVGVAAAGPTIFNDEMGLDTLPTIVLSAFTALVSGTLCLCACAQGKDRFNQCRARAKQRAARKFSFAVENKV